MSVLSAKQQKEKVCQHLKLRATVTGAEPKREWPSYQKVLQDVRKSDYNEFINCPHDIHPLSHQGREKKICPLGMVCCAKLELFPQPSNSSAAYTGLLAPGTTSQDCLVRLSSALQPTDTNSSMARLVFGKKLTKAKLFPSVAIKIFRGGGVESGNILCLGKKIGQPEDDFFAHCVCTQITSRMPTTLKPIASLFKKYSDYPFLLGLSHLSEYNAEGERCLHPNFPFCLTLKPKVEMKKSISKSSDSSFLNDIESLPTGTVLYDLFASPNPMSVVDPNKLQRIGRLVTTSEMTPSPPNDGLIFRHQVKDDDFALRSSWQKEALETKVRLKDGSVGPVAAVAGCNFFENQIQHNLFVDFEKES